MKPTAEKLTAARDAIGNAVQALRDAMADATSLQADCIGDLIQEAANLKRKAARLADVIEQDSK